MNVIFLNVVVCFCACGTDVKDGCSSDADCNTGRICESGSCRDKASNNSSTSGSNSSSSGTTSSGGADLLCGAGRNCPAGQFCFNGLCAVGCQSNGDCAADQYCATDTDRLCHNKVVTTCPETPCPDGQVCNRGFCSAPPPDTQCDPARVVDGQDGCATDALCLEKTNVEDEYACSSFPACPMDGTCPTGTVGAVCNKGIIPNKGPICLTGLCQATSHCPANWKCIKKSDAVVGMCSNGDLGFACLATTDCDSGLACTAQNGTYGLCFTDTGCASNGGQCVDMATGGSCPGETNIASQLRCPGMTELCCK